MRQNLLKIVIGSVLLIAVSCSTFRGTTKVVSKKGPEYNGVDLAIKPYVDEFLDISKRNNITFTNKVTVGVKRINTGAVIGLCTTKGTEWREIDIDYNFFVNSPEIRRKALIFHELIHCYCTRGHDHSGGTDYPSINTLKLFVERVGQSIPWCLEKSSGYFDDGCASSIMHPYIQELGCLQTHWDEYMKEMFDRCEPF